MKGVNKSQKNSTEPNSGLDLLLLLLLFLKHITYPSPGLNTFGKNCFVFQTVHWSQSDLQLKQQLEPPTLPPPSEC